VGLGDLREDFFHFSYRRIFCHRFPQLYVNGELIGGLDIVKEMVESGEFKEALAPGIKSQ
jgi:glutaredoxin-related protein